MNITKITDINNIIMSYVNDLKLWDKYERISTYFKHHIQYHYTEYIHYNDAHYLQDNECINMPKWLYFKNSYLHKHNVEPSTFEEHVELRYRRDKQVKMYDYDFEMMLYDKVSNHTDEDSWGSIDPADWHVF